MFYLTKFRLSNRRYDVETTMTIRIDRALVEGMKQAAERNDRSMSAEVRMAMRSYLQSQEQGASDGSTEACSTKR